MKYQQRTVYMSSFAQHSPQSKSLQFGLVVSERWFGSSSKRNRNKKPSGGWNMKSCATIKKATKITFNHLNDLSPEDIAAFWMRISHLAAQKHQNNKLKNHNQRSRLPHQLRFIYSHTMNNIETFGPRDLAQTALGFAKVVKNVNNPQRRFYAKPHQILHDILIGKDSQQKELTFQSIANVSMRALSEFEPHHLSNLSYANAIVDYVPMVEDGSTLFYHIAEKSFPLLRNFEPQYLSNLVWSFGTVGESNPMLFKEVANAVVALDHLGTFIPQNLSNILFAFAKAEESHPKLFEKIADHIVALDDYREFYPQAISNAVWSFAKAEVSHPMLFQKMAAHIVAQKKLVQFYPQVISDAVWAFATAEESHPELFDKIADHISALHNLSKFDARDLSRTVWAFAKAGESQPVLFEKVADRILALESLHSFSARDLANTVWAFATAGESQPRLFRKVADHLVALDDLHAFGASNRSQILWAFTTADIVHSQLFDKLAGHANENKHIGFKTLDKSYEMAETALRE